MEFSNLLIHNHDVLFKDIKSKLTEKSKRLFPLPDTAQVNLNIVSMTNFLPFIKPILDTMELTRITEIGSYRALTSKSLANYVRQNQGKVSIIDPILDYNNLPFSDKNVDFYCETSEQWFKRNLSTDVYFVDGDHSYYTLNMELKNIQRLAKKSQACIAFLHDVGWPWGARDLYYNPESIPADNRHKYQKNVYINPLDAGLATIGCIMHHEISENENSPKNGLMSAVEDFLKQNLDWQFIYMPTLFGLGVLWKNEGLKKETIQALENLTLLNKQISPYLATLEFNRIMLLSKIEEVGKLWDEQNRWIKEQSHQIEQLSEDIQQKGKFIGSQSQHIEQLLENTHQKDKFIGNQSQHIEQLLENIQQKDECIGNQSQRIEQLLENIQQKDECIGNQSQRIEQLLENIQQKDECIGNQSQRIEQLLENIQQKDECIGNQSQRIKQLSEDIQNKDECIGSQSQHIKQLSEDIQNKDECIGSQSQHIKQLSEDIQNKDECIGSQSQHIKQLSEDIQNKDECIGSQSQHIKQLSEDIQNKDECIGSQSQHIKQLSEDIQNKDECIGSQSQHIKQLSEDIQNKDECIGSQSQHIKQLSEDIQNKDKCIGSQNQHIKQLSEDIQNKDECIGSQSQHIKQLSEDIQNKDECIRSQNQHIEQLLENIQQKDECVGRQSQHIEQLLENIQQKDECVGRQSQHIEQLLENIQQKDECVGRQSQHIEQLLENIQQKDECVGRQSQHIEQLLENIQQQCEVLEKRQESIKQFTATNQELTQNLQQLDFKHKNKLIEEQYFSFLYKQLITNLKSKYFKVSYLHRCIKWKNYKLFAKKALNPSAKLVSVDIFDTLLLRETVSEPERFYTIGELFIKALSKQGVAISLSAEALLHYRLNAAKIVYRHMIPVNGVREGKYEDIASLFLKLADIPQNHLSLLKQVELNYEVSVLSPNKILLKILYQAQQCGKKIICLSDMYFSSKDLTYLVTQKIPNFSFDAIISSADVGIAKHSGHIYNYLLNKEKLNPLEFIHCGDNKHSDVVQAQKSGIEAVWVPRPKLWRQVARKNLKSFKTKYQLD